MKKLVNGKVINIDNIELFELAAEGLALQSTTVSTTNDGIEASLDNTNAKKFIKYYDIFFKSMPYPLYAIERDIKYATLGNFINSLVDFDVEMWVDGALFIRLDKNTGMTLKVVNNTWSIVYDTHEHERNIDMGIYADCVGYTEYVWLLDKIINKVATANFYSEFMPDFVKACNNNSMTLKWELENMLTFGAVPSKVEFRTNRIIDIENNKEFSIDIYTTGYVDTDEKIRTWDLSGNGSPCRQSFKKIRTYGFDAYEKPLHDSMSKNGKQEKCKLIGLNNLFMQLCSIKNATEATKFPEFEGAIVPGNYMVFTIDKRLFIARSNKLCEAKDIAHNVDLYSIDNGKVYFTRTKRINSRVNKESLYSYGISDGSIRLCKTLFSY